ncbi:hypothetical protein LOTGIDRAFT_159662 [Lottia gigantea]|uniref:WD repeat-containing protein 7 n=1 Tax=Lottia gigantea TaxID=225164 RepID=V4AQ45_LOTGI|nr:hypothetical protein LOTGIDRAFT_159662 [Lottia gigantea]ESO96910.1 hypothetical protein LOTGIDRAFT_159662 [Lottia gigantea]
MSGGSSIVVPMVLWGKYAPTHCISAILATQDLKNIVTGCNDGQILVWDLTDSGQVYPRSMLFGHTTSISCLALGSNQSTQPYIVSASENGEMCLWDISDGRCIEYTKLTQVHTDMVSHHFSHSKDLQLVCNGYYPEVLIINPVTFEIVLSLSSKVVPDWISACCVLKPVNKEGLYIIGDVVLAISNSGTVKVWTLTSIEAKLKTVYEDESKQIRCLNAQTLTCCSENQRTVLIVCSKYWQVYKFRHRGSQMSRHEEMIYDASDFTLLCSESSRVGERWSGGDFVSIDRVLVWSNEGKGYLFKLPTNADPRSSEYRHHQPTSPHAYYVLDIYTEKPLVCTPAMTYCKSVNGRKNLLRGDSEGKVIIWTLPEVSEKQMTLVRQESFDRLPALSPRTSTTLQDVWDSLYKYPAGILEDLCTDDENELRITSTIYIPSQGKIVCGRQNGSLVIVPATQSIIFQLLETHFITKDSISKQILEGHDGRVTCLLYPFNESTRYEPQHLLSGGADFSVILWDIYSGYKIHTFTVHGGELTQMTVPPSNCHLDRVVQGITAEEILNNCDENATPMENLTNPSLTLAQAFRRRNFATFRNLAQQRLQASQHQQQTSQGPKSEFVKPTGYPMLIQGVRTNTRDSDSHVLFFDTESLIVQLLTEEFAMLSPGELEARGFLTPVADRVAGYQPEISDAQQKIAGLIAKAKEKADTLGQKIQDKVQTAGLGLNKESSSSQKGFNFNNSASTDDMTKPESLPFQENMTMQIAQIFMSCLHAWGLDPDLDKLCLNKLGLLKPQCPISFGLLSRQGHMSLMLPGWHKRVCQNELADLKGTCAGRPKLSEAKSVSFAEPDPVPSSSTPAKPTLLAQRTGSIPFDDEELYSSDENQNAGGKDEVFDKGVSDKNATALQQETEIFSTKARWQISSAVTTQHLLSVISVANTMMSMSCASFLMKIKRISKRKQRGSIAGTSLSSGEDEDQQVMQQAQIKQGWSLLAALHCVLLPELVGANHYEPPQLEMLARRWQDRCLEIREAGQALLLAELRRIGIEGRKAIVDDWSPFLPMYVDPNHSLLSDAQRGDDEDDDEDDEQMLAGDLPPHKVSISFESRRKQATAIVMLGVVGAEFGHEIEPSRRKVEETNKKGSRKPQEGFSLTNYSLSRHTSKALTFLLLTPPNSRLPAHTPIRRAAIDLIGRGFTVWEPYLDVSAVLLGLLELCIDADILVPSMTYGLPLSPAADAARTARHALTLIATARPAAFIITMAKEVARYNAQAQNAQSQHTHLQNLVLVRARHEIQHILELMVEKMPNEIADIFVETVDVVVHCLDMAQLKSKGLQELFPAICRFSMVSHCSQTKRIWVGAKNGNLALYEMKQHSKCQLIPAHQGPIIAVSINPDGKYLCTFSHVDCKLKFWQTASSSIFGIGSQQTKCIRQYSVQPIPVTPLTNILKLVRLVWIDNKTVVLLTVEGKETKFSV